MKTILTIIGCTMLLSSTAIAQTDNMPLRVKTENGVIEGFRDTSTGLRLFLGVPFARPPVGPLRWRAPQPAENWEGVLQTKVFGPRPVQTNVFGDMVYRSASTSEDCLYLNLWTPATRDHQTLPVMVIDLHSRAIEAPDDARYRFLDRAYGNDK